ncbi:hypothetical protein [Pseudomonas luteola]|uniref:hypothetical protein n=1 Tax=Pseudomonas luteola TaxID=47886 RepID=UPI001239550D|nr:MULTISPECIES: hypothetical protein [Pseudomonas]MBA1247082.1 hypothetical protein [Pseudomonas zeshuii]QEU28292.1 hypothetical protein FOB45_10990 [Pseudomonas luteola]
MPVRSPSFLLSVTLASVTVLSGCANHLPQRSEHEERVDRKLIEHSLQINAGEKEVLELPQRRIKVLDQHRYEVTDFEVTRHYDRYTPYQPWRELYEVPLGAVTLVAGIGANILNVPLLGSLPESATHGLVVYGLDGLNPFMNVVSNGRSEQNLASIDEKQLDKRVEYTSLPWAERPVEVKAGKARHELLTDQNGFLRLNLLEDPFAGHDISGIGKLDITVIDPEDQTKAERTLTVSRSLRSKLLEAHELIYDDLEEDDVTRWVHRVKRLSELGLEEESSELEQNLIELTHNDPELQNEFVTALAKATGTPKTISQ